MNYEWTRMEEGILKAYYNRVPFDELCGMLPNRSAGAVSTRALALKLNKTNTIRPERMPNTQASTLEELKTQVAIKEAELAVQSADSALTIFDDQMVAGFVPDMDMNAIIKANSGQRSKMVAALSRARLKLAMARMNLKIYNSA